MVCYSRRPYWLPADAARRSPGQSAAGPARIPTDTPSNFQTGNRLAMRSVEGAALRRLPRASDSAGGSGASAGSGGVHQHAGTSRAQLNLVVVDTGSASNRDIDDQQSRNDITAAPCTDNIELPE